MATSSITKKFVIKDDETMKRLINALEAPKKQRTEKKSYEKGKALLLQHYGGLEMDKSVNESIMAGLNEALEDSMSTSTKQNQDAEDTEASEKEVRELTNRFNKKYQNVFRQLAELTKEFPPE